MPEGDKHVLAETQVAGFGMANGKVVERLLIEFDEETPAAKLVHDRLDYAEPLRDRDPKLETLREIVANPHDSHRTGEQKLETGSGYGKDRVIVDRHEHAPCVYIRHEHFDNGEWTEAAAWELHPATGVEEVGGELVTDGGTELGVLCDVDDCENRIVGLDDGWEFSRGTVCQDCIDYQSRHGHWPDESVDICAECRIDDGMVPHECEESAADRVLIEPGSSCDYCGFEAAITDGRGVNRPSVDVDTLDYDGSATHDDPIEGQVTRHYYECPNCEMPLCEWMDCPDCGWYDEDVWTRTLDDTDAEVAQ